MFIKVVIDQFQNPRNADTMRKAAMLCRDLKPNVHHEIKLAAMQGNTHLEIMLTPAEVKQLKLYGYTIKPGSLKRKIVSWG